MTVYTCRNSSPFSVFSPSLLPDTPPFSLSSPLYSFPLLPFPSLLPLSHRSSCLNNNPPQSPNIVLDEESLCPEYESHWMSAELLSYSVDFIDTLLEDWYPGLGCREGGKTMDYIPYVNRVIPCPFCISSAIPLEEDMAARVR